MPWTYFGHARRLDPFSKSLISTQINYFDFVNSSPFKNEDV